MAKQNWSKRQESFLIWTGRHGGNGQPRKYNLKYRKSEQNGEVAKCMRVFAEMKAMQFCYHQDYCSSEIMISKEF